MCSWCSCRPGSQDHRVDVRGLEAAQFASQRRGRADEAAREGALQCLRIGVLPLLVFVPQVDRPRRRPLAVGVLPIKAQRELKERDAVGAAARFIVGLGAL